MISVDAVHLITAKMKKDKGRHLPSRKDAHHVGHGHACEKKMLFITERCIRVALHRNMTSSPRSRSALNCAELLNYLECTRDSQ